MATGKTTTQNMPSGSRTNSRRRVRTSSTSAGRGRSGLLIAQLPPSQREEDIFQHRPARRELLDLRSGLFESKEKRGDRLDEGPDRDRPVVPARARVVGARDRGDEREGRGRIGGELEDVGRAQPSDEL